MTCLYYTLHVGSHILIFYLAHLAKGKDLYSRYKSLLKAMWDFGITWRSSVVVCHLLTFHILIFSETHQPNELKLSRKHLWKVLSKACTFCYESWPNMDTRGNVCFWLANFKKSTPLKPLGHINRNLVGSIYGMSSMTIAHVVPLG